MEAARDNPDEQTIIDNRHMIEGWNMILHFTDGKNFMNICFDNENYNLVQDKTADYITLSESALDAVYAEIKFNDYDYETDILRTKAQKKRDAERWEIRQDIINRINSGELLTAGHGTTSDGKQYPRNRATQRDIIYATMLVYPDANNSEIARMTGASRGTIIRCREDIKQSGGDFPQLDT